MMEPMNFDQSTDAKIRSALCDADSKGKLGVVSAVIGSSESELRKIMNGADELSIMDRGMLGMHLLSEDQGNG